ncbi:hypothetical protein GCM10009558_037130 [Virgisporangium aurantiacum]
MPLGLGKLVAMILDVEWDTDISGGGLAWRDALAGVDNARLPELATRWAGIEELAVADWPEAVEGLRDGAASLANLARRAGPPAISSNFGFRSHLACLVRPPAGSAPGAAPEPPPSPPRRRPRPRGSPT